MAKFFSVVAEMENGTKALVPAQGGAADEAFRQVKGTPGVRRVGKVTEITQADHDALLRGERINPSPSRVPHPPQSTRRDGKSGAGRDSNHAHPDRSEGDAGHGPVAHDEPAARRAAAGHAISGPRVIQHAPRSGEKPFTFFSVPPPRPKPPRPPEPKPALKPAPQADPKPVAAKPKPAAPSVAPTDEAAETAATPMGGAYRIVKSRRQDGSPYLLQRGDWHEQGGKRTFKVEWEKGFADRAAAEKHQEWVTKTHQEHAEEDGQN